MVRATVNGLNRLPTYRGTVYRGTGPFDSSSYQPGAVVTDPAFVSASMDFREADRRSSQPGSSLFVIQSQTGRRVDSPTGMSSEGEILSPPGSRFLVVKREERNSKQVVFLEEVPSAG